MRLLQYDFQVLACPVRIAAGIGRSLLRHSGRKARRPTRAGERAPNRCWRKLEAQDRGQTARALADDLPLFAVPSRAAAEPAPPSAAEKLLQAVEAMHPDEMSPREALEALYALKAKLQRD